MAYETPEIVLVGAAQQLVLGDSANLGDVDSQGRTCVQPIENEPPQLYEKRFA
jgi:hypothetical protein